jgi:hypothetical protein
MTIQTKNFYAYGLPTGIVANKGVVYTNVQDGKQYVQLTVPYGSNWVANGQTNFFYYPSTGAVNTVTGSAPIQSSGGTNPNISIPKADASTDGYLSSEDWNTFNSGSSVTPSALTKTDDTNVTLALTGSPTSALLQAVNIAVGWSGTLADSRISSASVWNAKQNALAGSGLVKSTAGTISYVSGTSSQFVKGDGSLDSNTYLTSAVTSVGATSPLASTGGNTPTLSIQQANSTQSGYLSSTDWNTFNNKGSGTVTSVGATSPITSSGGATPTISTSMATNKLIGRTTAGAGVMEEISVGSGLTLSSGTLSASPSDSITHATASGTDTYTATITGVTAYADGDVYLMRFTNGNTTGCTLNINGLGAVTMYRNNDGALIGGDVQDGAEMLVVYNSTSNIWQCIGTSPNSLISYVTNADSVTLTKGMPVYAFGGQGDRLTVKRAYNTGDSTSAQTIGLVLSTSIASNQKGFIMMQGLLDGLSILPTSTWADGDPVYLGATAGTITKTKPYAPNHLVYLGFVTTASNGSAGRLYVRVQNGYELDELHNVQAQSPTNKDTIYYDSSVNQWKSNSIASILGYTPADASTAVTSVSGTSPIVSSGGTTPAISLPVATSSANGYLSSTDWTTFNNKMTSFAQFRKAGRFYTNGIFNPQGSAFTNVANTIRYVPFYIDQDVTISRLGINVVSAGAAASTCRLGIYTNDSSTTQPLTRLVDTGTIDLVATGAKSVTGLSVALTKGLYWFAYFGNSASGSITAVGANFVFDIKGQASIASIGFVGFNQSLTYTSLPASAGTLTEVNGTTTVGIFYYY